MNYPRFNSKTAAIEPSDLVVGGFKASDILEAFNDLPSRSFTDSTNTYAAPASHTSELQKNKRPHYLTQSQLDRLVASIPLTESNLEAYLRGAETKRQKSHKQVGYEEFVSDPSAPGIPTAIERPGSAFDESTQDYISGEERAVRSRIDRAKNILSNHEIVHENPLFDYTSLVQPGHIVTLRNQAEDGSMVDTVHYLLSQSHPDIERAYPGAVQTEPGSFLGRELLLKKEGDEISAQQLASDPSSWAQFKINRATYKNFPSGSIDEDELVKQLIAENLLSSRKVPHGTIVKIEKPTHEMMFGSPPKPFNSGV
jgi:transcription elongation GreA/GreB family factor